MPNRDDLNLNEERQQNAYPRGKNYLLVIGIDKYKNNIQPLNNAVRDAKAFRKCLIDNFQFEEENCKALFNENATKRKVYEAFKTVTQKITDQDNLVFYFSGHGTKSSLTSAGYWMLVDAESGYEDSFFHNQLVIDFISSSQARHIYGFVDSCFSGTMLRQAEAQPPRKLYQYKSRYLLTSGREEVVSDGTPGRHSPYAEVLLNELQYCHNEIWGEDLARNVLRKIKYSETSQMPRGSYIHGVGHMGGEMIFMKKGSTYDNTPNTISQEQPRQHIETPSFPSKPVEQEEISAKTLVKELFVLGDYDKGFEALKNIVPHTEENTYYLLRSQYSDYRSTKALGTRSDEQLDLVKRRLTNRILGFIDDL